MKKNKLEEILKTNQNLIQLFNSLVAEICTLIKNDYVFILINPQLILLDYSKCNNQKIKFLEKGMLFSDTSIGSNAIYLAQQTKKPVYLTPEYHYSALFKEWYCFTMPLIFDNKIIGFLDVSAINKELKDEMIAVTKLLAKLIVSRIKTYNKSKKINVSLTEKQRIVLKYLIKGFTEQMVALEMGVCISTIKYHKKNIFKILEADNTTQAIAKAIKIGILNVEEIDV